MVKGFTVSKTQNLLIVKAVPNPASNRTADKLPGKKRSISGLGGLINAIVAKVDKREDKIVEFTESNDDGALLSSVNLGLVKIKKQQ